MPGTLAGTNGGVVVALNGNGALRLQGLAPFHHPGRVGP